MANNIITSITAIFGIVILEIFAMHKGYNGQLLRMSIGLLGLLGGLTFHTILGVLKNGKSYKSKTERTRTYS